MNTKKRAISYLVRLAVQKTLGFLLYYIGTGFALRATGAIYFAMLLVATMVCGGIILRTNERTLAERGKTNTNSPGWDKLLLGVFWLLNYFVVYFFAGFGERTATDGITAATAQSLFSADGACFWSGIVLVLLAGWLTLRATLSNTFLESTARIQTDRGQTVCSTGPYAVIRHPAYTSILLNSVGVCLVFPSVGVIACMAVVAVIIIIRTALEDRMLDSGLEGYTEYAAKVKYRLLPFIW